MNVVIDVSAAAEILVKKEKANEFYKVMQEADIVFAPDIYISELSNTFWKYTEIKKYNINECIQYIQDGLDYIDIFINSGTIWEEAFSEGVSNNHSVYDMFYMVTARKHAAALVTNDSTLAAVCRKNHVQVCC